MDEKQFNRRVMECGFEIRRHMKNLGYSIFEVAAACDQIAKATAIGIFICDAFGSDALAQVNDALAKAEGMDAVKEAEEILKGERDVD